MRISDWSSDVCSSDLRASVESMVGPVTLRKAYQRVAQASPNGALPSKKDGRKRTQPAVLPLPHTMAWLQVSRWRGPTRAPLAQPPAVSTRPMVHQGNEVSEKV